MKDKKVTLKDWLNGGSKKNIIIKKVFVIAITMYLIYNLGYAIGTFWANISL